MPMNHNVGQQVVNARLMAEVAIQFNIGADIFGKGNRTIESKLGSENMSGDTVMVPVYGGGETYRNLDLTTVNPEDLAVKRDAVPVRVGPYTTATTVTQEDLTLSLKSPEFLAKRVAQMALDVQMDAVKCLERGSINSTVINQSDIISAGGEECSFAARNKVYDLFALCEASKFAGDVYGVIHPMVWSKLIAIFQGKYAPNPRVGEDMYKNELGELAGIKWSKTELLKTIAAKDITGDSAIGFDFGTLFASYADASNAAQNIEAPMSVPGVMMFPAGTGITAANYFPATGNKVGDLSQPFYLKDGDGEFVVSTDIFGNPTGRPATFRLRATAVNNGAVTGAVLAAPFFFEGPRQNVYHSAYKPYDAGTPTSGQITGLSAVNVLTAGKNYLQPALVWKKDDFLIAAKGLEKYYGSDSLTVPTRYSDKGYLPIRGWCFTLPMKARTVFRTDVLLGMEPFLRVSMNALYIEA